MPARKSFQTSISVTAQHIKQSLTSKFEGMHPIEVALRSKGYTGISFSTFNSVVEFLTPKGTHYRAMLPQRAIGSLNRFSAARASNIKRWWPFTMEIKAVRIP